MAIKRTTNGTSHRTATRRQRKRRARKRLTPGMECFKSALTTGSRLMFADIDHRSQTMRRLRDILHAHQADLGGEDQLSEGQKAIARKAATIQLQTELLEQRFAQRTDGSATVAELECFQRATNTLRRAIESLGLNKGRVARVIDPSDRIGQLIETIKQAH